MGKHELISVIVPCHNSQTSITATIERLNEIDSICEIIAIENGSSDKTWLTLNDLCKKFHEKLVVIESAKGLGNALKSGVEVAKGDVVIFIADDMPFGTAEISYVRNNVLDDSTLYISSKYYKWETFNRGLVRLGMSLCFIIMRELILKTKVRDSQGGFFGRTKLIKDLLQKSSEQGFLVSTELVHISRKLGLSVVEVPVDKIEEPKRQSTVRFGDIVAMFTGLFKLKNRYRSL